MDEEHEQKKIENKNRVKIILTDLRDEISAEKLNSEDFLKKVRDNNRRHWGEISKDRRQLTEERKEKELSHDTFLRSLRDEFDTEIDMLRREYEIKSLRMMKIYSEKTKHIRASGEKRIKDAEYELENQKLIQTKELIEQHKQHTNQLKKKKLSRNNQ
uniref:Uncharacterized protein n=1 Tax=Corethron hystrix TaxID=216773 RepID=A0A7S1BL34_9STRA|mmetsp:Transcript_30669/g.70203  ORF Transcript_30669/g.70203 Transcript_30669/m.70203 type:complete len:158 (+) Transcript_30669:118-591(+)